MLLITKPLANSREGIAVQTEFFEIKETKIDNVVRFYVKGRISSSTSVKFTKQLNAALSEGKKNMILDMSEVQFLSSLGIRTILSTYKQCDALGGSFHIANPPPSVANVLGMAALNTLLLDE